ncbi:MAG TPA: TRAM domain-containing protein, partial [Crocinitomicaceae bacterium]|nr:TRAM domain-containing protein [Crocinitomicaceae bacterium]
QVLIEGISKKSEEEMYGRNSESFVVVFAKGSHKIGDYVDVKITEAKGVTLRGEVVN